MNKDVQQNIPVRISWGWYDVPGPACVVLVFQGPPSSTNAETGEVNQPEKHDTYDTNGSWS